MTDIIYRIVEILIERYKDDRQLRGLRDRVPSDSNPNHKMPPVLSGIGIDVATSLITACSIEQTVKLLDQVILEHKGSKTYPDRVKEVKRDFLRSIYTIKDGFIASRDLKHFEKKIKDHICKSPPYFFNIYPTSSYHYREDIIIRRIRQILDGSPDTGTWQKADPLEFTYQDDANTIFALVSEGIAEQHHRYAVLNLHGYNPIETQKRIKNTLSKLNFLQPGACFALIIFNDEPVDNEACLNYQFSDLMPKSEFGEIVRQLEERLKPLDWDYHLNSLCRLSTMESDVSFSLAYQELIYLKSTINRLNDRE